MTMNKLKCILIDDEFSGRIVLKELLGKYCPNVDIIGEAASVREAYEKINSLQPDFIFLDIQMPGENGFDLLKKFDEVNFNVIFVTSYDKYAITAIKFSALDYLLKPVDISDLAASVEKVKNRKKISDEPTNLIINLLNNIDVTVNEKKLAIHHTDKVKFLNLSDIICFEAANNYTTIFTSDNQKYTVPRVLKDFEDFLPEQKNFIRLNKGVIVNAAYIQHYSKGEPCIIYLKNKQEYEISRRRKIELKEVLQKLFLE
jgi:two-component system, LytTR family, response regulator